MTAALPALDWDPALWVVLPDGRAIDRADGRPCLECGEPVMAVFLSRGPSGGYRVACEKCAPAQPERRDKQDRDRVLRTREVKVGTYDTRTRRLEVQDG